MSLTGKIAKSEKFLLLVTAAFCILLTGLFLYDCSGGEQGSYTVATQYTADPSELIPETKLININTASAEELEALPGIGEALAERIIAYREAHGPFQKPEDLKKVSGIGDGKYSQVVDLITVDEEAEA